MKLEGLKSYVGGSKDISFVDSYVSLLRSIESLNARQVPKQQLQTHLSFICTNAIALGFQEEGEQYSNLFQSLCPDVCK